MNRFTPFLCLSLAIGSAFAADPKSTGKTDRKTITVINAEGRADGQTEIKTESVRECIISLPSAESVEADIVSDSRFLREINGDANKNAWTKVYTARIVINYMVYKKDMLIVATRSVEGREPTLKEVDKKLPQTREFVSNAAEGDLYAGRSNRQYYFSKPEDAVKDAKHRAQVWLKQQTPLLCGDVR